MTDSDRRGRAAETTDEALRSSGFETLFTRHPQPAYVFDVAARSYRVNERMSQLTGFPVADLQGDLLRRVVQPAERESSVMHREAAVGGREQSYRSRGRKRDGEPFLAQVTLIPLRGTSGAVAAVLGVVEDISERQRAIEDRERTEAMLRVAGRVARFGGWTVDGATGVLEVSDGVEEILGLPFPRRRHYLDALEGHPEPERALVREALERTLSTGEPIDLTVPLPGTDGSVVLRLVGGAVRDGEGRVVRAEGAFCDVTYVVEQERLRQQLQERIASRLDQMATGIGFLDSRWRFTYVNQTAERYIQNPAEALLGRSLWDVYPEAFDSPFGVAYRRAMNERVVASARSFYAPLDTWFEATAYPIDDGIAIHLLDVTEDQRNRTRLHDSMERLRAQAALLDAARDAIIVRDLDDRIQYWNGGAEAMLGWSSAETEGLAAPDFLYIERDAYDEGSAIVLEAGYWTGELKARTSDGRVILLDCRWQLVRDEDGTPSAVFAVESDLTEWRRLEDSRYRDQRIESLGTLAGGIAHDLNNVLTPILMSAQLLAATEKNKRKRELIGSVETGAKRGAKLIRQVLDFARGDHGERRELDVTGLLEELVAFCRQTLPAEIGIHTEIPTALPAVVGDPTRLFQVLMNLVTNAADAMPGGGTLTIRALAQHVGTSDAAVRIGIEDTGIGMDEATTARIFEPFFTTKDRGEGTGLGLSTSLSIVRSHGGSIDVSSAPGLGSSVRVILPTGVAAAGGGRDQAAEASPPRGSGQLVLVVDDEPEVRGRVGDALRANGYRPVLASNGREALGRLAGEQAKVVVIDMVMPQLGGVEVVRMLRETHPSLSVVGMSGMDEDAEAELRSDRHARFLRKPFTLNQLLHAVADSLAG